MASSLLCCFGLVLNFPVLFQYVEAVSPARDNGFATVSNNAGSDPCNQLNDHVKWDEKRAADRACGQAFLALDEHNANSCRGWRQPACRLLTGSTNQQCSCLISICNQAGVTSDETKSFRECASDLRPDWYFTEQAAQASGFHGLLKKVESKVSDARARSPHKSYNAGSSGVGGSSKVPNTFSGAGLPGGVSSKQDAETSRKNKLGAGGKTFTCDICMSVFRSRSALRDHRIGHTEDLQCKICQKRISTRTTLLRHINEVHNGNIAGTSRGDKRGAGGKTFPCDICKKVFQTGRSMRDHRKRHSEDLQCKICEKPCSSKTNFFRHVNKVHDGNIAAASFEGTAENLEAKEKYLKLKPWECVKCGNRYVLEQSLRDHMRCHNTLRTTCTICNRAYSSPTNLKYHMESQHKASLKTNLEGKKE